MRYITILLVNLLFVGDSFAQRYDSLGIDNAILLNRQESEYLNNNLLRVRKDFDFNNKSILFVYSGNLLSKKEYFNKVVLPWIKANPGKDVSNTLVILTEKEKKESNGFNAIVLAWWKRFGITEKQKRKIFEQTRNAR